ncbi:serine hydrolase [Paenibacillus sp. EKM208P]|nr:serine hydrolase [Paenibacillus sp. EKM208P]
MTFRSLAFSNIKGNWRAYSAFFLSSSFSVMIFYMYAAFLYHPDVVNGYIVGAEKLRQGLLLCEYIIIVFSFLFILYSNTAFLKTRTKEFGLFTLLGTTRRQIRKLIIYENLSIAILAIVTGTFSGILFSRFFFMILAVLLNMEDWISFSVPFKSLAFTSITFFILFTLISIINVIRISKTEVIDLITSSKKSQDGVYYSKWMALLAAICLVTTYYTSLIINGTNFVWAASIILIAVMIGTYFLFTQLSIFLLNQVRKRKNIYYKKINLITISQLSYNIKGNARMLFIVSILNAVTLTASGTLFMFIQTIQYEEFRQMLSLTMFIGIFISLLFFLASGSIIYFKLFTELQEDQVQYKALMRIGLVEKELKKTIFSQVSTLFFIPSIVGIIHALFALKALDNLLMTSNWGYSFIIIGVFLLLQFVYFLVAYSNYLKSIKSEINKNKYLDLSPKKERSIYRRGIYFFFGLLIFTLLLTLPVINGKSFYAVFQTMNDGSTDNKIQRILEDSISSNVPGAMLGVLNQGQTTFFAAGKSNIKTESIMEPDNKFRIGSVTKIFTATAILQLVGEKKIDLNDSIEKWLPGLIHGNEYDGKQITIRRLLNHTSGLADYANIKFLNNISSKPLQNYQDYELVNIALSMKPTFEPGKKYNYSNTDYVLLGMIINKVTGKPYSKIVEEKILQPLNLKNTFFPGSSTKVPKEHFARGYIQWNSNTSLQDITNINVSFANASGEMISTTEDLNIFLCALMSGKLLNQTELEEMKTIINDGNSTKGYGLGLQKTTLPNGEDVWGHVGGIAGYYTIAYVSDDGSKAATLSVNAYSFNSSNFPYKGGEFINQIFIEVFKK